MTTNNPVAQPDGVVEVELLPCPFCGGPARQGLPTDANGVYVPEWQVYCDGCEVEVRRPDATMAKRDWNRRPTPNSIAEQARRVVAAIVESSPWMQQFEVTPKERERLASIITTEFGASGGDEK